MSVAGLDVPLEVFEQLFHHPTADSTFEPIVRGIDWSRVSRTYSAFSTAATVADPHGDSQLLRPSHRDAVHDPGT